MFFQICLKPPISSINNNTIDIFEHFLNQKRNKKIVVWSTFQMKEEDGFLLFYFAALFHQEKPYD